MDNIKKGDRITADWANALTNAINGVGHGKTSLRGGGGQTVSISPYQRGNRPLAFDLVKITDDGESSLTGKISGGILLHAYKEEESGEEKKILLKTEKIVISEYEDSFSAGEKVWVHVTYDADTWEAYVAILEKGPEPPEPEEGEAYIVVGEFEEHNRSIIYKHKGITCINWDMMKWEGYKLKTDPKCALEIKDEGEGGHILTLNIESSTEDVSVTTELRAWLVQEKGKGEGGEEEGPVKLGVRIRDGRPDYTAEDPIEIKDRNITLKIDKVVYSTQHGLKYNLEVKDNELAMKIDTDSMTVGEATNYTAEDPIEIDESTIKLNVNTEQKTNNGIKYKLDTSGGQLDISIDATSLSSGTLSALMPLEIANNQIRLRYASYWKTPANGKGIRTRLWEDNNFLSVDLDVSSFESVSRVCDSWTILACDSNYALRPQHTPDGDIYIQQARWDEITEQYEPIN